MQRDEVVNGYFEWLMSLIAFDGEEAYEPSEYRELLDILLATEFYWSLELDGNRAYDGLHLRALYSDDYPRDGRRLARVMPEQCSVLEMLIALARRCENEIMYDPDFGDRTGLWFWIMVENLGLTAFPDRVFRKNRRWASKCVCDVVETFLDRGYEADGTGSIFSIRGFQSDMRETELWYQMQYYLNENFGI